MGLLLSHRSSFDHDTGAHPENAGRIRAVERRLEEADWLGLDRAEAPLAPREAIERVHLPEHVERLERFCEAGGGLIDADTLATAATWEAAVRGAGAAVEGAERVLAGEAEFAFCMTRPPGHHAESDRAMGFCIFNNAAAAAAHAVAACGVERVLILDWDVHHGNGTAEIFQSRADVLYASIHQAPLYPGTGSPDEVGTGAGEGFTVNLPVPAGTGGEQFNALVQHVVVPVARDFAPGLLIVSAGYDAHAADPLAGCELTSADFAAMTAAVRDAGREIGAPLLFCLEGGYDPDALADSVQATLLALDDDRPAPAASRGAAAGALRRLVAEGRWRLDPRG